MTDDEDLVVRVDCRWYRGSMPCEPHKRDGRRCHQCTAYDPLKARVLIVKIGALGDVLRTTALLPSIRRSVPQAHVTWITGRNAVPLIRNHPLVDRVVVMGERHLDVLLTERFQLCLSLDSEYDGAAAARLARCDVVRGFVVGDDGAIVPASSSSRRWWQLGIDDHLKRQNRRTWFELMSELCEIPFERTRPHLPIDPAAVDSARSDLARWRASAGGPLIGLNPGGSSRWAHKRWSYDGYTGFIRAVATLQPRSGLVLLGGPDERELQARILADVGGLAIDGGCHDDVGRFAALVGGCDVLVTSDTLGFHVATAVGTRVVALVGPTSPWELDTFDTGEVLTGNVECLACYRSQCDRPVTCMERLDVSTVVEATCRQLAARGVHNDRGHALSCQGEP